MGRNNFCKLMKRCLFVDSEIQELAMPIWHHAISIQIGIKLQISLFFVKKMFLMDNNKVSLLKLKRAFQSIKKLSFFDEYSLELRLNTI